MHYYNFLKVFSWHIICFCLSFKNEGIFFQLEQLDEYTKSLMYEFGSVHISTEKTLMWGGATLILSCLVGYPQSYPGSDTLHGVHELPLPPPATGLTGIPLSLPQKGPGTRDHGVPSGRTWDKRTRDLDLGVPDPGEQTNWKHYLPHPSDAGGKNVLMDNHYETIYKQVKIGYSSAGCFNCEWG